MRKCLITWLLVALTSISGLAQSGWVDVAVFTDQYAGETSWDIKTMDSTIVASRDVFSANSLHHNIVYLPSGPYIFTVYDSFGDGICCGFGEGWYSLTNLCGLDIYDPVFGGGEVSFPFYLDPCEAPVFGCMDSEAVNFHPWATMPSPCNFPPIECEEGSSNIIVSITPDTYAGETSWELRVDDEIVLEGGGYSIPGLTEEVYVCLEAGDTALFIVMDTYGDGMCGSCWGGVDGDLVVSTLCGDTLFNIPDTTWFESYTDTIVIPECINPLAVYGCTEEGYTEYNPQATNNDGSCLTPVVLGCVDSIAFNFDTLANTMDMIPQCEFALTLTDGGNDGWFGAWMGVTQGDSVWGPFSMQEPITHLPFMNGEPVSFYFFAPGNASTTAAQCGFNLSNEEGQILIQGGTNPWTDPLLTFPYKYIATPTCGNYCIGVTEGCLDTEAQNFSEAANIEDGSCYYNAGCMQAGYLEYYTQGYEADFDDGSCDTLAMFGCMDDTATNFDLEANVDNGSCIDTVVGCMDINAFNFVESANVADNESCLYDAGCIGEAGTPYWANDSCYSWIIIIDPYCCEVDWDNACIELYNYCSIDWPQGVPDNVERINIYPNPTRSILNIESPSGSIATVYSSLGRTVVVGTREKQIDLSGLSNGLYEVVVDYRGRIITQTIIKR